MIALKLFLTVAGVLLVAAALGIPLYGLWLRVRLEHRKAAGETDVPEAEEIGWRGSVALALVACLPLLVAAMAFLAALAAAGAVLNFFTGVTPGRLL